LLIVNVNVAYGSDKKHWVGTRLEPCTDYLTAVELAMLRDVTGVVVGGTSGD